jgi:hypothetical protein
VIQGDEETSSNIAIVASSAFPVFFLDITEETYNVDLPVALYGKKFPFRAVHMLCDTAILVAPIFSASGRKVDPNLKFPIDC